MQAVYGGQPNKMYPYVDARGQYHGYPVGRQQLIPDPPPHPMYSNAISVNGHAVDPNIDGPSYFYGPTDTPASYHGTPFPHSIQMPANGTPAGILPHLPQNGHHTHSSRKHGRHVSAPQPGPESYTRHRTTSQRREDEPRYQDQYMNEEPDMIHSYVYMSFSGHEELIIENLPSNAAKTLEGKIFTQWSYGFHTTKVDRTVSFRFDNSPWRVDGGSEDLNAMRMIRELLRAFYYGGYEYRTTMHPKRQPPQLVFAATTRREVDPLFFVIFFTNCGHDAYILDAPAQVNELLWRYVRRNMPHKIFNFESDEKTMMIKMNKAANGKADKRLFKQTILQALWQEHPINITIPLGPRLFGLGFKRELLVFKGIPHHRKT